MKKIVLFMVWMRDAVHSYLNYSCQGHLYPSTGGFNV